MKVDMKFEVAIVPVSDVDRAKAFYTKLGWRVDDDIVNGKDFRAVQLTPPNSAASVTFGKGVTDAKPGSFRGGLIVSDILAAHKYIAASGIQATDVFHSSPFSPEARIPGPDPERKSYSSYVAFQDPDGDELLHGSGHSEGVFMSQTQNTNFWTPCTSTRRRV